MKITGRQSRAARALLKWNISEVVDNVSHMKIATLEQFEAGMKSLSPGEMQHLIKIYEKEGIQFMENGTVIFKKPEAEKKERAIVEPQHPAPSADSFSGVASNLSAPGAPPKPAAKPGPSATKIVGGTLMPNTPKPGGNYLPNPPKPPKKTPF